MISGSCGVHIFCEWRTVVDDDKKHIVIVVVVTTGVFVKQIYCLRIKITHVKFEWACFDAGKSKSACFYVGTTIGAHWTNFREGIGQFYSKCKLNKGRTLFQLVNEHFSTYFVSNNSV